MVDEAKLDRGPYGLEPRGEGWFVLNVAEAAWIRSESFGRICRFEGNVRFPEVGINVHVVAPGQPACRYHRESAQEDFLVLSGECLVVIEEEVRRLKAWDFVHCPAGTNHVFVGAGDGPCAILMVGARGDVELTYPVSAAAKEYGASVDKETHDPAEAYAGLRAREQVAAEWPL